MRILDVAALLEPAVAAWLSAVGVKLEAYAATAVAADAQAPGGRAWAPLARLSGVLCSSSVVDLFYVLSNSVDKVAARVVARRPPAAAAAAAEAVAAAAGGAVRWYAAAVEAAALDDLRPVALAAHSAGTLPPAGRALLSAHFDDDTQKLADRAGDGSSPTVAHKARSDPPRRRFCLAFSALRWLRRLRAGAGGGARVAADHPPRTRGEAEQPARGVGAH